MPGKIDIAAAPQKHGSTYPAPFQPHNMGKHRHKLGDAGGLTQFGVNRLVLEPGMWSAQRHWHANEDEFVYVLEGEVVLVNDDGETLLAAGDCAGFPAGEPNGHHLQNRSNRDAVVLEVGTRNPGAGYGVTYPDIDLALTDGRYCRKDGTTW